MKNNYKFSNQKLAYTITAVIVFVSFITIVIPLFFLYTFPTSQLAFMFFSYSNNLMSIIGFLIVIYFVISGVFYFTFKGNFSRPTMHNVIHVCTIIVS